MGDRSRNCKRMASVMVTESSSTSFSKKMRIGFSLEEMESVENFQLQAQHRLFGVSSPEKAISRTTCSHSGGILAGDVSTADSAASLCSSNVSSEAVKDSFAFLDLEAKSSETESSTCISHKFSRETTPSSEFCGDTDYMDKPEAKKHHRRNSAEERTAPQEEIDEFFAAAEKMEQRRFADKYNYDIAKDEPLEGRYQWIRLKP